MNLTEKFFSKRGLHNVKFQTICNSARPGASFATLGSKGVPMKQYCDMFNKESLEFVEKLRKNFNKFLLSTIISLDDLEKAKLSVKMRIYDAKNWEVRIRSTTAATLIKMAVKLEKGSATAGKLSVGTIERSALEKIAALKLPEMNARTTESATKMLIGTAKSMGLEIKN